MFEANDAGAWKQSVALAASREAAGQLAELMSELSEKCYCAGWLMACEFTLWRMQLAGGGVEWGQGIVTAEEAAELRRLSELAGGWVAWPDDAKGEVFVPANIWAEAYAEYDADLNRCASTCDKGSRCTLPIGHDPRTGHETEHGCIAYDPPMKA